MATRAAAMHALLLPLLLLLLYVGVSRAACGNASALSERLDTLLAEYDRGASPAPRLPVRLALTVRHAALDERHSAVRMLADLQMSWEDSRLKWNTSVWGCGRAGVPAERLWLPDVVVVSAATRGVDPAASAGQRARLASDGRVEWTSRLDLSAPLALRLDDWPRDLHTAVFKFASRDHDSDQLDLTVAHAEAQTVFEAGAWELASVSHSTETWRRGDGERRVVAWALSLRRRAPSHALATTAVLSAAALLLLAALLLPPAARSPLCACASFTAAIWLISALVRLPGSATTPLAVELAGALCICGGLAALCTALTRRLAAVTATPPRRLRTALAAASALCSLAPESEGGGASAWAAAALLLDRALRAALTVAIFIILCLYL
ncbi:acetylcholine receptor subunit beta [Papilio machaon]|uniref:acetylcholine receptor subunit beta n=1 Tax=Papilio machaon TaxID=76193 RepID=UPI001E66472B|nr:acetylcholine receptor subunit beta [Papilio machaon]XP_045534680.1 acetylcholine receptor subunit beta [Papilio machaon]